MLRTLILFVVLMAGRSASSQQYNYLQYTVTDGLPSNTVYDVKQDKDGFIWVATDAGLSRFDGRTFQTFTVEDGLPANDVLYLMPDMIGRVWVITLSNSICYYYQGKFHTPRNDSLLKQIRFQSTIWLIAENDRGDIMFTCSPKECSDIYILTTDNTVIKETFPSKRTGTFSICAGRRPNEFIAGYYNMDQLYANQYIYDGKWRAWSIIKPNAKSDFLMRYVNDGKRMKLQDSFPLPRSKPITLYCADPDKKLLFFPPIRHFMRTHSMDNKGRTAVFTNTDKGVFLMDSVTGKFLDHLIPDKVANRSFRDMESNIWIATENEGLIMIPSTAVKSVTLSTPATEIFSLARQGNITYAGSSHGRLFQVYNGQVSRVPLKSTLTKGNNDQFENRLRWIEPVNGYLLLGFDNFLIRYNPVTKEESFSPSAINKSISVAGQDSITIAAGYNAFLVNSKSLSLLDTIYRARTYCALKVGRDYYVGTPSGPVRITEGEPPFNYGDIHPKLQVMVNRILRDPDGGIWMSTYGNGVFKIRNDSIIHSFNTSNGLNSNSCKAMVIDNNFIWVGTEKGINRINRHDLTAPVLHYTKEDGLASNDIHSLFSDSSILYAASTNTITWFDTSKIRGNSICYLRLLNIRLGNRIVTQDSLRAIPFNDNNLRFEFTGLSFRSSGNIQYLYRLKGLSDVWDSTRNNNLEFLALPPGKYELDIFARNKFGQNSNTISIRFVIDPPFWATWWFRLLIVGLVVTIAWWAILRRIRNEKEKASKQNRINELEQQALRSQMNPHFIFNCLNSIQNFLLQNNFDKTNEYLTAFAHLIRQTLDNSSRSTISIEAEIKYLSSYLELECMRFAYSFNYSIEVDPDIDTEYTHIPTMILQPYVENSIRHGIRYRQDGEKAVKVSFLKRGNTLVCMVEDSGVGRKKASELKSFMHLEYQSKGMRLNAERIEALNRMQDIPITVDVIDLQEAGNATGTQVIVRFPNMFL